MNGPNIPRDKIPPPWPKCSNLEQWMKDMMADGRESEVVPLLKLLKEPKATHYREIWKKMKGTLK